MIQHVASTPSISSIPSTSSTKIWYDRDGDFLEVLFPEAPGHMRETGNHAVIERLDASGNLLGFSVMNVSALPKDTPLTAELMAKAG